MATVKIPANVFINPMPVVIVGAMVNGRANFLVAGWVARANFTPPMVSVALGKHHTNAGILQEKAFSLNIPSVDMVKETDYCGLASGKTTDKSNLFELADGELANAPLIATCPLAMQCRLVQTVELPTNTLFIGEIVAAYADDRYLVNGSPDVTAMRLFTLTMPDNTYWAIGDKVAKAWNVGKSLLKPASP